MEVLANIRKNILQEGSRDNLLSIYLPLFQKRGMNVSLSQLKQALLAKFVNEGSMNNLSLESNYYLAGVAKYYFNGDLTTNKRLGIFYNKVDKFNPEICQRLNALIPILRNAYIDSVGTQFEQPEDFGELNINQLLRKYGKKIDEALGIVRPKKIKEIPQEVEKSQVDQSTDAGKDYTYEVIYDYEQCKKYKQYTDPGAWCITYGKQHYDGYIKRLKIHYVIFKKNGFENIPRKKGLGYSKSKPQDEYGNSLIALLQSNEDGHCVYITSRWNHGSRVDGTEGTEADHAYTPEEFLSVIGCDQSVLERCFEQWKEKIEQLKKEGKKTDVNRKEINAKNLDVLRAFKYAQMKLNGGAKITDVFGWNYTDTENRVYRASGLLNIRGMDEIINPDKSLCRCVLKYGAEEEAYTALVDKKKIIFETIRKYESTYNTCKKYNNIIVYCVKGSSHDGEFVFYDLLHHKIVDFNGIKKIKYLSWDLAYYDVKNNSYKYVIFAVNGSQVCLFNTESCKIVKTPRGDVWFETITQETTKYGRGSSTTDYRGRIKIFEVENEDILNLDYDSASGEHYLFNCQSNSFIDINKIEQELGEGYSIGEKQYSGRNVYNFKGKAYIEATKLMRVERKQYTDWQGKPYEADVKEYAHKYYNVRTNQILNFNGINEFKKVDVEKEMIAFEPFNSDKVYFYNRILNKLVDFNGKLFIGNGGNKYGHLGFQKDPYLDMYQLETNCQREGNVSYFYIPEDDYFYHDDINGYEFKYYGSGQVYKDKNDTSKNSEKYKLPTKKQIQSGRMAKEDEIPLFEKRHLILKENKTNMKSNIMKFLNDCEGWKTYIKNSHWSSSNMNEHKLFDDIADSVSEIQDMVAEIAQGLYGQIKKGELKANKCNASRSKDFLKVMLKGANDFYSTIKNGKDYIGMRSEMETFIGKISQFQYLMDLSLKEDFKRNFKNKLISEQNHRYIKLNEKQFKQYITECVKKIIDKI